MFSFPLRLFVCFHDFGCCLSSGGMYTCSYPTLVQLSGAFGGLPCFFFLSLHFKWCFLVFFFLSLHWFIQTSACFFSVSQTQWFISAPIYICRVVAWCIFLSGSHSFVTTLQNSFTLFFFFALCAQALSLWSSVFVLEAALYLLSIQQS